MFVFSRIFASFATSAYPSPISVALGDVALLVSSPKCHPHICSVTLLVCRVIGVVLLVVLSVLVVVRSDKLHEVGTSSGLAHQPNVEQSKHISTNDARFV